MRKPNYIHEIIPELVLALKYCRKLYAQLDVGEKKTENQGKVVLAILLEVESMELFYGCSDHRFASAAGLNLNVELVAQAAA